MNLSKFCGVTWHFNKAVTINFAGEDRPPRCRLQLYIFLIISPQVKARSAAREVIATYSVDDIYIELVIQLPQNYPLGSITVESGRRVGVAVQQWRNWMLQLSTYLTHQNGSIMEGLALWKNNVDKRFEGIEDCMICFSVIHGSNYSLPKKACRTCKKKFHSACLYKWFTSSNKSTCPLCRETFF
ncbi:listerin E3 ubiquitin protein ligase 1 [Xenotaenia resolanae]|uniref:E3 ubiquitin-protein ligase listerin n=1 Tax=Xenotaenia resolanae TaxID=208358 RepID=A0ABV0VZ08_9TELE